jgi:hypothetical protein
MLQERGLEKRLLGPMEDMEMGEEVLAVVQNSNLENEAHDPSLRHSKLIS